MDKFLETYNLLRLNHEEIENLNRPVMSKVIELAIKNLQHNIPSPNGLAGGFYETIKKKYCQMVIMCQDRCLN